MRTEAPYRAVESTTTTLTRRAGRVKPFHIDVPTPGALGLAPVEEAADPVTFLADGGIWSRVPAPSGLCVTAVRGDLWVTQGGGRGDVIVREGESFKTTSRGKVVAQAMGPASFTFDDRA